MDWLLAESDRESRHEFLRRLVNVLPEEDLKKCFSLISKTRKRRKEIEAQNSKKPNEGVAAVGAGSGSVQSSNASLSVPTPLAPYGWLRDWTAGDVVGLDVEKVSNDCVHEFDKTILLVLTFYFNFAG